MFFPPSSLSFFFCRRGKGAPVVEPSSSWSWGKLLINEKLNSVACKVIQDIAKLFVGNINTKIQNVIENNVPVVLEQIIRTKGNQVLQELTKPLNVDSYASIDLSLAKNPIFTKNAVEFSLLGIWGPPSSSSLL